MDRSCSRACRPASVRGPRSAAGMPQQAEGKRPYVDRFLQQRAPDRRQVAEGGHEHRDDREAEAVDHALAGDVQRPPPDQDREGDPARVVDRDHHVGGLGGDRRSLAGDRDADVGEREGRGVVDPVPDHDDVARARVGRESYGRRRACPRASARRRRCRSPRSRATSSAISLAIARDERDVADAGSAEIPRQRFCAGTQAVCHHDDRNEVAVDADEDLCVPGLGAGLLLVARARRRRRNRCPRASRPSRRQRDDRRRRLRCRGPCSSVTPVGQRKLETTS